MIAPALLVIAVLFAGGLLIALAQSLGYFAPAGESSFTLAHYARLLSDVEFRASLAITLLIATSATVISAAAGLSVALALRDRRRCLNHCDHRAAGLALPAVNTTINRDAKAAALLMNEATDSGLNRVWRIGAVMIVAGLAIMPLALLTVWSFARAWFWPALLPREWSLRAWAYVFSPAADLFNAAVLSLGIAAAVTLLALLAAVPAARALALHDFRGKRLLLFALLLPVLAPPLAATMGMHSLFLRYGLADTILGVVLAHLVPAVPYSTLMLAGSFSRLDPDLEAQARTRGG
jgi:ABC-type spermidine/putrescine transport system permease subunit II